MRLNRSVCVLTAWLLGATLFVAPAALALDQTVWSERELARTPSEESWFSVVVDFFASWLSSPQTNSLLCSDPTCTSTAPMAATESSADGADPDIAAELDVNG